MATYVNIPYCLKSTTIIISLCFLFIIRLSGTELFILNISDCTTGNVIEDVYIINDQGIILGSTNKDGLIEIKYVTNSNISIYKMGFEKREIILNHDQTNYCLTPKPLGLDEFVVKERLNPKFILQKLILDNRERRPMSDTIVFYECTQKIVLPEHNLESSFNCIVKYHFKKGWNYDDFVICAYTIHENYESQIIVDSIRISYNPIQLVYNNLIDAKFWKKKQAKIIHIVEKVSDIDSTVFTMKTFKAGFNYVQELIFDSNDQIVRYRVFNVNQDEISGFGRKIILKSMNMDYSYLNMNNLLINKIKATLFFNFKKTDIYFINNLRLIDNEIVDCLNFKLDYLNIHDNFLQLEEQRKELENQN
ncbi:MAG: hypothetical protein ISR55_10615 [Bacteroidetes bacterium]|nr:hypothetical protein [Bacteroidota bacterium]